MEAKEIENRLRDSIRDCEYDSIEELARDSGIDIPTIQKFLNGGDIFFSDAAQLITTIGGSIVLPNDWLDMKANLMEELDI